MPRFEKNALTLFHLSSSSKTIFIKDKSVKMKLNEMYIFSKVSQLSNHLIDSLSTSKKWDPRPGTVSGTRDLIPETYLIGGTQHPRPGPLNVGLGARDPRSGILKLDFQQLLFSFLWNLSFLNEFIRYIRLCLFCMFLIILS